MSKQSKLELPPGVKLLRALEEHAGAVVSVAFDPRGRMRASGSADNTVKLWDVQGGRLIRMLEGHASRVAEVS